MILIDEKTVSNYNITKYHPLFSAAFKEINLLPVSLGQNIAVEGTGKPHEVRVEEVL